MLDAMSKGAVRIRARRFWRLRGARGAPHARRRAYHTDLWGALALFGGVAARAVAAYVLIAPLAVAVTYAVVLLVCRPLMRKSA